jgi:simple sugar transport system permease protein
MDFLPFLSEAFFIVLFGTSLRASIPLLLAALGETYTESSGVLNLGIEGIMLSGAFCGFVVALFTENLFYGFLAGLLTGLLLALLIGVLTILLRVNQIVVGLGVTIFASGITSFLFRILFGTRFPILPQIAVTLRIPGLADLPYIGSAFFNQHLVVYLSLVLIPFLHIFLYRTHFGLKIRAVGESPISADAAGVNVAWVRFFCLMMGGMLAGLGGAFLAIGDLSFFVSNMTLGRGFIAIAIVMLGKWNPYKVFLGALIFGITQSLASGLQVLGVDVRPEFVLMLPYVTVLVALVIMARNTLLPSAFGLPYYRGQK